MKKTYIIPEITLTSVEFHQMIAESLKIDDGRTAGVEYGGFVHEERAEWDIWEDPEALNYEVEDYYSMEY